MRYVMLTILKCDRRFTIHEIWELFVNERSVEVSYMTMQHILATELHKRVREVGAQTIDWRE